jgi:hypothetical protein
MKVILAGSTGFIGREVLTQCLKTPSITSILALSRRELPGTISDPRLKVVILKDFASYPDSVLKELASADACIWYGLYGSIYIYKLYSLLWPNWLTDLVGRSIGTYNGNPLIDIEYPLAFANAFVKTLAGRTKQFRYVHLGGMLTEQDQEKRLWYYQSGRRVRVRDYGFPNRLRLCHTSLLKLYIKSTHLLTIPHHYRAPQKNKQ